MSDIIQLLPDNVVNQIAAGEVIQRPSSVAKELMENAIDSGASSVLLRIKDAGKTLIQVVDDGKGMSFSDAKTCFLRHATSKLSTANDLYKIHTKGFRGEAMATIAAISHVTLETKTQDSDIGTSIELNGGELKKHEECTFQKGTSVSVKHLFFNVPARRNFLKSNSVELKHIYEEFFRVALIHHDISFRLVNNDQEVYNMQSSPFRQRIVALFGKKYNERLVPISESTDIVNITGFIGKPEFAKKIRGEQYFFINNRFIKNGYLHHAVSIAFEELLPKKAFPSYFICFEVDPARIDVNIHPTKIEVKLEDDRAIHAILRTAVKLALGKHNITPTIDFDVETSLDIPYSAKIPAVIKVPEVKVDSNYNPFDKEKSTNYKSTYSGTNYEKKDVSGWENLYQGFENVENAVEESHEEKLVPTNWDVEEGTNTRSVYVQLHNTYILTRLKSKLVIIHQQRAHERVLYEIFLSRLQDGKASTQQLLFPEQIDLSTSDALILDEILLEIKTLGFDIEKINATSFAVNGVPVELKDKSISKVINELMMQHQTYASELSLDVHTSIAISLAKSASLKSGKNLSEEEMKSLIDQLFATSTPNSSPTRKPIIVTMTKEDIDRQFEI